VRRGFPPIRCSLPPLPFICHLCLLRLAKMERTGG
jgi:hypothetical protein